MFEKMGNPKEDELFLTQGQIEIDIAIRKEKRKEEQEERNLKLKEMLREREMNDLDFFQEFSEWQKIERDIAGEIEDTNEYGEEQVRLLVREADIFAEPGLKHNKPDLINQALDRLEGTEEMGYYDGALYDAQQKADAGIIDNKIVEEIELKISEFRKRLKEGS